MTMDEFKGLLDAWGGDVERWPANQRAAAEALLRRSDAARALLAEEAAFDALLADAGGRRDPDPALLGRILAIPGGVRQERAARRRFGVIGAWPRLVGLAAAAVMGFYIGTTDLFVPARSLAADNETVNVSDYVFGDSVVGEAAQ